MPTKQLKICANGHRFYKSSDCPVCPQCEKERAVESAFLAALSAPARRALEANGITTLKILSSFTEKEILALHGVGKTTIPTLQKFLEDAGLSFRK